jgi:hypothetical protein
MQSCTLQHKGLKLSQISGPNMSKYTGYIWLTLTTLWVLLLTLQVRQVTAMPADTDHSVEIQGPACTGFVLEAATYARRFDFPLAKNEEKKEERAEKDDQEKEEESKVSKKHKWYDVSIFSGVALHLARKLVRIDYFFAHDFDLPVRDVLAWYHFLLI